jgi:hypothetical protein
VTAHVTAHVTRHRLLGLKKHIGQVTIALSGPRGFETAAAQFGAVRPSRSVLDLIAPARPYGATPCLMPLLYYVDSIGWFPSS